MSSATVTKTQPTALIVGMGKTGLSVIAHLAARGYQLTVADSRNDPPGFAEIARSYSQVKTITGRIPVEDFSFYDEVVVSPGIAIASDRSLVGDVELFAREVDVPVIAITGSNGKSTVTTLVETMLRAAGVKAVAAGNIGTPVLDGLRACRDGSVDVFVLELSSFQLETTHSLQCAASTVLNLSEDHMDRYQSLQDYSQAKYRVFTHCECAVVDRDQSNLPDPPVEKCVYFSRQKPRDSREYGLCTLDGERWFAKGEEPIHPVSRMTMRGEQNVSNILAAISLIDAADLPGLHLRRSDMVEAALAFPGLPHRCEVVLERGGVVWINDSKATNVGATLSAIESFALDGLSNLILIAGGQGKAADFSELSPVVKEHCRHVVLFGEDAQAIHEAITYDGHSDDWIHRVDDLQSAIAVSDSLVRSSLKAQQSADTVLFSPACASFDMFDSFEHRGDSFRASVQNLKAAGAAK
ncbi:MAG: UDP-N-acetylmuramoyl-L-alanine--D-glutamate ligase [Pseudomonadota bacterium]